MVVTVIQNKYNFGGQIVYKKDLQVAYERTQFVYSRWATGVAQISDVQTDMH